MFTNRTHTEAYYLPTIHLYTYIRASILALSYAHTQTDVLIDIKLLKEFAKYHENVRENSVKITGSRNPAKEINTACALATQRKHIQFAPTTGTNIP